MHYNIITILGPTATGKTKLAAQLSHEFNGEIISADSRQVYKRMDIGTGKDYNDYKVDSERIKYHLIDIIEPAEEFNLFSFIKLFDEKFAEITSRNKLPFLVGGTGLYLSAVLQNYKLKKAGFETDKKGELSKRNLNELREILLKLKPHQHNKTDLEDKERLIRAILIAESNERDLNIKIPVNSLTIGVKLPRDEIKNRITARLKKRLDEGMIDEVKSLVDSGLSYEKLNFFGLEYKFVGQYLNGELNYNDMFQKLNSAIHNFAKRQMTWFRKMEREGVLINWIDGPDFEKAKEIILKSS